MVIVLSLDLSWYFSVLSDEQLELHLVMIILLLLIVFRLMPLVTLFEHFILDPMENSISPPETGQVLIMLTHFLSVLKT